MIHPSHITPDMELKAAIEGNVLVGTTPIAVYGDWERPTNNVPTDFVSIYLNGDIAGVGMDTPYAKGYIIVSLYCKLNDDGSVKKNRVQKILEQFDTIIDKKLTENYYFEYDAQQFITPTTPNQSSGYSVTSLNLRWNTNSNINNSKTT